MDGSLPASEKEEREEEQPRSPDGRTSDWKPPPPAGERWRRWRSGSMDLDFLRSDHFTGDGTQYCRRHTSYILTKFYSSVLSVFHILFSFSI